MILPLDPAEWPGRAYATAMIDPPWRWMTWSDKGQGRSPKYKKMSFEELCYLPVGRLMADDSAILVWGLDTMVPQVYTLAEEWGFKVVTVAYYWAKTCRKSPGFHMGNGYWTRANPETCFLATRGKPQRIDRGVRRLIVSPLRENSRKPDVARTRTERLLPGPYVELFARDLRPGWDAWGQGGGLHRL